MRLWPDPHFVTAIHPALRVAGDAPWARRGHVPSQGDDPIRALTITAALAALLVCVVPTARSGVIPPKLAKKARYLAAHGGITGSCHGCATGAMKTVVRRLIVARFHDSGPGAVSTALCVAAGESGFNPGAISRTGDYGVFQINKLSWFGTYDWGRILDPVYNVGVGWAMSQRGFSWSPWVVWTNGSCRG